jgi:surface protein
MEYAFTSAANLNIKATDTPDLSKVQNMSYMFSSTINLTGNFSGWNTSKVQNMSYMFNNAENFDQDLSSRNVEGISSSSNMQNIFQNAGLSTYNYNAILDSRSKQNVRSDITNFAVSSTYGGACAGVSNAAEGIAGHAALVAKGWTIIDSGEEGCVNFDGFKPFVMTWKTTTSREMIQLPLYNNTSVYYNFDIDW